MLVPGYPDPAEKAAFRRAFERDKESLREMGIPLDLVDVPGADPPDLTAAGTGREARFGGVTPRSG